MRVAKWGNSLAIRLPQPVIKELDLKVGDDIDITLNELGAFSISKQSARELALTRIKSRSFELPLDYRFDREEANARGD